MLYWSCLFWICGDAAGHGAGVGGGCSLIQQEVKEGGSQRPNCPPLGTTLQGPPPLNKNTAWTEKYNS